MSSVQVGKFPSASTPGKYYTVSKDSAGVIWCDCWAWRKNRTCSHKKAVEHQLYMQSVPTDGTGGVAVKERKMTIQEAIDRAVAEMKGS